MNTEPREGQLASSVEPSANYQDWPDEPVLPEDNLFHGSVVITEPNGETRTARGPDNLTEMVFQLVGMASSPHMWMSPDGGPATQDNLGRPCTFQSEDATKIAGHALSRIYELMYDALYGRFLLEAHEDGNSTEVAMSIARSRAEAVVRSL